QATDFTLPNDRPNQWETSQERALALKKQLANLNRLESPQTRRVMTIDVEGRRLLFEDAPAKREENDGDGQEVTAQKTGRTQHQQRMGGTDEMSAGTGTMELAKKAEEKVGKGKGKEKDKTKGEEKVNEAGDNLQEVKSARPARLQHEIDVGFAERLLLSGEDGGRESTVEPGYCWLGETGRKVMPSHIIDLVLHCAVRSEDPWRTLVILGKLHRYTTLQGFLNLTLGFLQTSLRNSHRNEDKRFSW
ncbi:hypothetical protein BC938DRAFT_475030, partial [Jimgerdemannia flammicorona]